MQTTSSFNAHPLPAAVHGPLWNIANFILTFEEFASAEVMKNTVC